MFRSGIAWLKLQTKLSIAIFSLQCLLINSILLFFTLKDKVLLEFDIEQQPLLLYVITLVVRFLAGVVTDLGLLIGVYFSMKALIIVNVVWKGTGAIFDIVHGATFFPHVYQQLRQLIDHIFSNEGLSSVGYEETLTCTLYLSLALLMGYGTYRINLYYRGLYMEDARMTTVDVAASRIISSVSST
ncbi:uncharacterized protein [Dermacentor andersoni]|uniref:uncharacterized protein isoform X1 n=1 Tax=Dermacentor andersoni TaxID=34620 RepID=UPI002415BD23|nr:uncharacterized protein LOC129387724 [Dermacentor andersoni]